MAFSPGTTPPDDRAFDQEKETDNGEKTAQARVNHSPAAGGGGRAIQRRDGGKRFGMSRTGLERFRPTLSLANPPGGRNPYIGPVANPHNPHTSDEMLRSSEVCLRPEANCSSIVRPYLANLEMSRGLIPSLEHLLRCVWHVTTLIIFALKFNDVLKRLESHYGDELNFVPLIPA